ncbi:hypothetical protein NUU61_001913 [Penicillium alfredii]|uniref:Uncharacterized protein n=1 Tax=Penicillium alfredii TaxID=1506179 RepID=A0A9W9KG55_9EURO|nr:uncharacterized protein NUU61_001913 [Penicillium alfredii]KAJ5104566.1 hypothetical protein NUU61_001913 [Penicillium alfredii]
MYLISGASAGAAIVLLETYYSLSLLVSKRVHSPQTFSYRNGIRRIKMIRVLRIVQASHPVPIRNHGNNIPGAVNDSHRILQIHGIPNRSRCASSESTSCIVENVVASVGPYVFQRRLGGPPDSNTVLE